MTLKNPDNSSEERPSAHRRPLVEAETSGRIIGAFYHVWNILGFGLLESTYARALEISLTKRGLLVEREVPIEVFFEGERVGFHRPDMLVERQVVVEIKACHSLADVHQRQLLNYVTVMNLELGMLLHFGPKAKFYRVLGRRKPDRPRSNSGDPGNPGDP